MLRIDLSKKTVAEMVTSWREILNKGLTEMTIESPSGLKMWYCDRWKGMSGMEANSNY